MLVAELVEVMALRQAQGPPFDKLRDHPLTAAGARFYRVPSLASEGFDLSEAFTETTARLGAS